MTLEFEAIYDGEVFKPKTPIDLPEGTKILITEIIREEGKPVKLIGHVQHEPPQDGARGDQPDAADKE